MEIYVSRIRPPADIEAATEHVHLNYFIWEQDALTERFCSLLAAKIAHGVEVRIMYDWVGSLPYGKGQLQRLRRAGARVTADAAQWQKLNCRNHRKIAVIDGRIGYTGGMNMGQEYVDGGRRFDSWRDTHFRMTGPVVAPYLQLFAATWSMNAAGSSLPLTAFASATYAGAKASGARRLAAARKMLLPVHGL